MLRKGFNTNLQTCYRGVRRTMSSCAGIGKKIDSSSELEQYFMKSSWSTHELMKNSSEHVSITEQMVDGLLELSGLSQKRDVLKRAKLQKGLEQQLQFLRQLQKVEMVENPKFLTRLVDDKNVKPLDFKELVQQINQVEASLCKGEVENSWNPLSLAKEHEKKYFLVKEGLIKSNK